MLRRAKRLSPIATPPVMMLPRPPERGWTATHVVSLVPLLLLLPPLPTKDHSLTVLPGSCLISPATMKFPPPPGVESKEAAGREWPGL